MLHYWTLSTETPETKHLISSLSYCQSEWVSSPYRSTNGVVDLVTYLSAEEGSVMTILALPKRTVRDF
jgi:hypothetical protein